ncbi:hypothetical protein K788_00018600 [Paraburkholderia caribensis MBA4]|uniref:Uncharacterized protein n=1 Tax=Paraburkholderia caribensis MBA4 TaxID=1323664 RepID=A0A0P0R5U5_9BURK|nr:hypothetical protein K788_00018600 [Paraburkholderia caribensis MBA4]
MAKQQFQTGIHAIRMSIRLRSLAQAGWMEDEASKT